MFIGLDREFTELSGSLLQAGISPSMYRRETWPMSSDLGGPQGNTKGASNENERGAFIELAGVI